MADTATQQPQSQTIDGNDDTVCGHFHLGDTVDFQSQLFSVMSFDEQSAPKTFLSGGDGCL
jgi:hypothetical protein